MAVYTKQYGRLGNRCFQQAATIGYAMTHDMSYVLAELTTSKVMRMARPIVLKETAHSYNELPFQVEWKNKAVVLDGYFQSARYFDHCREEVLKAFGYEWSLKEGWCSIHVRRGDYLLYPDKHPVVSEDYLKVAVSLIFQKTSCENFLIFSDDIAWCKEVFQHCKHYIEYSEGRTAEEDLVLGSCCEYNIISNSTFSWWQAWLNQNPNKIVISPSKDNWFGPGNANLCTDDIIPESWIEIKY